MMEQYVEIRAANPDCLLFYRMGDFYELFFDDAVVASRALGITLTKRGKHLGDDIPMCGVPVHAADDYLQKLIALGHRVAVCEQTEDPAEARRRGAKIGGAARGDPPRHARHHHRGPAARFRPQQLPGGARADRGERRRATGTRSPGSTFRPASSASSECAAGGLQAALCADRAARGAGRSTGWRTSRRSAILVSDIGAALTPLPAAFFDAGHAEERLAQLFGVKTMESFGNFSRGELSAGAALIAYVDKTQIAKRPPIEPPRRLSDGEVDADRRGDARQPRTVPLDFRRARGHACLPPSTGRARAAGSRLLAERLASPLCRPGRRSRRGSMGWRSSSSGRRCGRQIRAALGGAPDMLRALSRLGLDRGGPRDLDMIRAGLEGGGRDRGELLREAGKPDLLPGSSARPAALDTECRRLAASFARRSPTSCRS